MGSGFSDVDAGHVRHSRAGRKGGRPQVVLEGWANAGESRRPSAEHIGQSRAKCVRFERGDQLFVLPALSG
jgi:hypothetical protein